MDKKINWGIISTAYIATEFVIPAMIKSDFCTISAISSRDINKAKMFAEKFNISKIYGDYQELLNDKAVEAVYIPLPNHMHIPWAIKALKAGKHVLLEKPISLSTTETKSLITENSKYPKLKMMEAFMYKFHPQWIKVKELVDSNAIGEVKSIQSSFSFYDDNPDSIVNKKEYGGGSLMDIGCYPISLSRYLFNGEPNSVTAKIKYHDNFNVDVLCSAVMEFETCHSSFFCSTILEENQKVEIFGTKGKILMPVPFNPRNNVRSKIILEHENNVNEIDFDICDQYTLQADHFSLSILREANPLITLEESLNNMHVLEKIIESDKLGCTVLV